MIAWEKLTREDIESINKAVKRAVVLLDRDHVDSVSLNMDLSAVQVGSTPMDMDKLLSFDNANFLHDIGGIMRHIDRETGELTNCFLPRSAR